MQEVRVEPGSVLGRERHVQVPLLSCLPRGCPREQLQQGERGEPPPGAGRCLRVCGTRSPTAVSAAVAPGPGGALKNQGDEFNLFSHCALTLAPTSVRYLTHILCLCMYVYRKKAFDCLLPPFPWHRALNSNNRENSGTGGQVFARIGAHSHTVSPVTQLVSW